LKGFSNWKDATIVFKKHAASACHREAIEIVITLLATTADVGELISSNHQR